MVLLTDDTGMASYSRMGHLRRIEAIGTSVDVMGMLRLQHVPSFVYFLNTVNVMKLLGKGKVLTADPSGRAV